MRRWYDEHKPRRPGVDDLNALLRAVIARTDDDTPRLVYADKLDDLAGENTPRAEFIRLTIERFNLLELHRLGRATREDSLRLEANRRLKFRTGFAPELPAGVTWD